MTHDTLQRFFDALVEALRERSPSAPSAPFTVAEIYQDLVPYRTHRDVLEFEMNGDYEHALLRLLAGQGGYLRLESEHALSEIREELAGRNPDTSLYRDFAAVDVRIEPGMVPDAAAKGASAEEAGGREADGSDADEADANDPDDSGGGGAAAGVALGEMDSLAPDAGEVPDTSDAATTFVEGADPGTSEPVAAEPEGGVCSWCRSELPAREGLVYCPFCGENQSRSPCRSCGEALEPDWEFCISCGAKKGR